MSLSTAKIEPGLSGAILHEVSQRESFRGARSKQERTKPVSMVVGITHEQTCLVLKHRLRALRLADFEVTLVCSPGELLMRTAAEEGVAAWPLSIVRQIAPLADLRSLLQLCWMLRRVQPSLTDFSTPKAGLLGNVAAWLLRVPHRVYTLRGLKLESSRGWKRRLLLWSERVAAGCAHVVLCNSESLLKMAAELQVAPQHKLRLLGQGSSNGVDTEQFRPLPGVSPLRGRLGISDEELVLGFVGRLTADKGVPELLEAFEEILIRQPDCWLLLVGWFDQAEDALEARWRARVAEHPRIQHVGYVEDTAEYYRVMDIMVLPTHREGFPNVVLEAAACGVPVITTQSTGARDAVVSEITGLLIPPGYPDAISEAVLALFRDRDKRRRMGKAAREWAVSCYDQAKVLGLAIDLYRGLAFDTIDRQR